MGEFVHRYVAFLNGKAKYGILCFWFGMLVCGLFLAAPFIQNTSGNINPPAGTAAYIATEQIETYFVNNSRSAALLILFESTNGELITVPEEFAVSEYCSTRPGAPGFSTSACVIFRSVVKLYEDFSTMPLNETYKDFFVPDVQGAFSLNYYNLTQLGHIIDLASEPHPFDYKMPNGKDQTGEISVELTTNTLFDTANKLMANDKQHTIMAITYSNADNHLATKFAKELKLKTEDISNAEHIRATATGSQIFQVDIIEGAGKDILNMDIISVPIGLCILCLVLRAPRLVIIPLLNIFVSLLGSYVIMYPISLGIDVISFAPSVMEALVIALSIDYACFILGRFIEECVIAENDVITSVENTLATAGKTVLVSGGTLAACFVGIAFFPLELIKTTGIGAVVAVIFTMGTALTLGPALILTFPDFFGFKTCDCGAWLGSKHEKQQNGRTQTTFFERVAIDMDDKVDLFWHTIASFDMGFGDSKYSWVSPAVIVTAVVVFTIPFSIHATSFDPSLDTQLSVPRGSPATTAFNTISKSFGAGSIMPYSLIIESSNPAVTVFDEAFYDTTNRLLAELSTIPDFPMVNDSQQVSTFLTGFPSYLGEGGFNFSRTCPLPLQKIVLDIPSPPEHINLTANDVCSLPQWQSIVQNQKDLEICQHIDELGNLSIALSDFNGTIGPDGRPIVLPTIVPSDFNITVAVSDVLPFCTNMRFVSHKDMQKPLVAFVSIILKVDPASRRGHTWYDNMIDKLSELQKQAEYTGFKFFLAKGASSMVDGVEETYKLFPTIIAITMVVVFVIVGGAFRSLIVPIRALITIALSMAWVYGLAVMIYVDGYLSGSSIEGLRAYSASGFTSAGDGEMAWFGPVVCFSVLVGLSLDYDIFLLERVHEYRFHGYSDKASVFWSLKLQGSIITAAGGIMVVAFGSLLGSKVGQLNQIAMMLVFGVLWFTFVNIPFLVPAMMALISNAGVCNWWPSKPPPATKDETDVPGDAWFVPDEAVQDGQVAPDFSSTTKNSMKQSMLGDDYMQSSGPAKQSPYGAPAPAPATSPKKGDALINLDVDASLGVSRNEQQSGNTDCDIATVVRSAQMGKLASDYEEL